MTTSGAMATYCGHCGLPAAQGSHDACARSLELEPPRYCVKCRRRMVVQVMPDRWTARCSEHDQTVASTWTGR